MGAWRPLCVLFMAKEPSPRSARLVHFITPAETGRRNIACDMNNSLPARLGGFTIVELVAVMVIVGILAAIATSRFFSRDVFDSRGFHDQVTAALRYAQKAAVAQHRFVCVNIAANTITLTIDPTPFDIAAHNTATCTQNLANPSGGANYSIKAPSGITVSAASFNFDSLGRPSFTGSPQSISVSGYTIPIKVEVETGYVHSP